MSQEWFGPVISFGGELLVGDPEEAHVILTPEYIVGVFGDRTYCRWDEAHAVELVGTTSPRLWSSLVASPVWLLTAVGLELPSPATRMHVEVQSGREKVELPITMRGRFRLTRKEVATINTLLRWLSADSSRTQALKSPDLVIQGLHRST